MNKINYLLLGLIILLVGWGVYGVMANNQVDGKKIVNQEQLLTISKAEKVQVFLFHSTQRCVTCIAIGKLARETVDEYFKSELLDDKIEYREINIDSPENKLLAQKFQASGSSLFLNAIYDGKDQIFEDFNVWRLTHDETKFKNYLKGKLNNLLGK